MHLMKSRRFVSCHTRLRQYLPPLAECAVSKRRVGHLFYLLHVHLGVPLITPRGESHIESLIIAAAFLNMGLNSTILTLDCMAYVQLT